MGTSPEMAVNPLCCRPPQKLQRGIRETPSERDVKHVEHKRSKSGMGKKEGRRRIEGGA